MRHPTILAIALTVSVSALHAQSGDPPSRAARISALTGQASLQPAGASEWSEAALNYTVTTGDRLYTAAGSRVELEIGSMAVRVSENSDVTVTDLADGFMQLGVAQGSVHLSVYRLRLGDSVEVDTPNGAVIVTTPGSYRIDVPQDDEFTVVSVDEGRAEVVGPGVAQLMRSSQAVQFSGTDDIRAISVPLPRQTAFDQWSAERDRRTGSANCSRYMSPDIPGCADLDEAGRWESNAQYGDVWYPTHVSAGWVPYREGRWAWIEPWGWSWVGDESWGYAPFHYGRWTQVGAAWGWIPGPIGVRPYYAPALVAFVGGSGWSVGVDIGTQAWFPLGPREAYVPSYHHDAAYLLRVNSANLRNVRNINTLIDVRDLDRVKYVNRRDGITAVPTAVFRKGSPVSKEIVTVAPEYRGRGSIILHPTAAPEERATLGGRPAAAPPAGPKPAMIPTASRRGVQAVPSRAEPPRGRPAPVPRVAKPTPPPSAAPRAISEPPKPDRLPNKPRERRTIITRTPPPPETPPFAAREPALQAHPGKPLEPQQIRNVRAGRPAGAPKDPETADHRVGQPPATTHRPEAGTAPAARSRGERGNQPDSAGRGRGKKPDKP